MRALKKGEKKCKQDSGVDRIFRENAKKKNENGFKTARLRGGRERK